MRFPFFLKPGPALIVLTLVSGSEMVFPAPVDPSAGVSQESQTREPDPDKDAPEKKRAGTPGFTVHTLRLGTVLFADSRFPQEASLVVENLSDALYSEFSNAGFFRPAPGRHVVLSWIVRF